MKDPIHPLTPFGEQVRAYCGANRITQIKLAEAAGVPNATMVHFLREKPKPKRLTKKDVVLAYMAAHPNFKEA